jgi:hypothetical protein
MARAVNPAVGVVSKARYAEHRGCSAAYVSKLIRLGRLAAPALLADGRVNVTLADQMLGAPTLDVLAPVPIAAATSRAEREAANARIARIRADEMEGALLPRDKVDGRVFDLVRRLRDELLAWPESVAPRLTTMTAERAIADLLTAELEEKLNRLAGELQDLTTHDDDPADQAEAA